MNCDNIDEKAAKLFTKQFLQKYLSLGFGNLPKKEIDILVFGLLSRLKILEEKNSYEIAAELQIDETRLRRLLLDASLRTEKNTLRASIRKIQDGIFNDPPKIQPEFKDDTITILIDDPVVKRDFVQALRVTGYSYDQNLNPERLAIPVYVFVAVLCKYDDELYKHLKEKTRAQLSKQNEFESAYRDGLPFLDKIKNGMTKTGAVVSSISALKALLF